MSCGSLYLIYRSNILHSMSSVHCPALQYRCKLHLHAKAKKRKCALFNFILLLFLAPLDVRICSNGKRNITYFSREESGSAPFLCLKRSLHRNIYHTVFLQNCSLDTKGCQTFFKTRFESGAQMGECVEKFMRY